jgi:hypothetical protein
MHEALFAFRIPTDSIRSVPRSSSKLETPPHKTDAAYLKGDRTYALTPV